MKFEYFYGSEGEQFSFYRIPKILFKDKSFNIISLESKILYGLMLDRMSLSIKNKWFDEENRVYIIYTLDDIIDDIGCGRQKAVKLLYELEKVIGLIERKRQGLGKPNIIYVKNFVLHDEEVCKSNLQKCENNISRNMTIKHQEVSKSNCNNTNTNNTDFNDSEIISYQSEKSKNDMMRWIKQRREYQELIKDNIDYSIIVNDYGRQWLDEIITLMVDVVCSRKPTIRINKQEYPSEIVKSKFLKINSSHIEYIYQSLKENRSCVRNIRSFLITTIYRAFETMDNWFFAKVNYDISQMDRKINFSNDI